VSRGAAHAAVLTIVLGFCSLLQVGSGNAAGATSPTPVSSLVVNVLGPGYSVVSQGPVAAGALAASSPNPAGAASALSTLTHSRSITTYQRMWSDTGGNNEIQDLVVAFSTTGAASAFFTAAQHALASGEIVSATSLSQPPGAFRTTYFATTTTQIGVGQAIALRSGPCVAIISFFSSNAPSNTQPISTADAQLVANDQYASLAQAQHPAPARHHPAKAGSALPWVGAGVAVVLVVALMLWVRRRSSGPAAPSVVLTLDDPLQLAPVALSPIPANAAPPGLSSVVAEPDPTARRFGRTVGPATFSAVIAFVVVRFLRRRSSSRR